MGGELGRHAVEERILLALELHDRAGQRIPVASERVGMATGVAGLDVAEWCLRHEGAQAGIVGLVLEERDLFLGDRQLRAQALETFAHVDEPPLEDRLGHGPGSLRPGAPNPIRNRHNGCMDVPSAIFTAEHDELRTAVRRFVDKELAPSVDEWEEAGYFPDWVFRRCGELGFLGLHYPERWGGAGGDLAAEIGRASCRERV